MLFVGFATLWSLSLYTVYFLLFDLIFYMLSLGVGGISIIMDGNDDALEVLLVK